MLLGRWETLLQTVSETVHNATGEVCLVIPLLALHLSVHTADGEGHWSEEGTGWGWRGGGGGGGAGRQATGYSGLHSS